MLNVHAIIILPVDYNLLELLKEHALSPTSRFGSCL